MAEEMKLVGQVSILSNRFVFISNRIVTAILV